MQTDEAGPELSSTDAYKPPQASASPTSPRQRTWLDLAHDARRVLMAAVIAPIVGIGLGIVTKSGGAALLCLLASLLLFIIGCVMAAWARSQRPADGVWPSSIGFWIVFWLGGVASVFLVIPMFVRGRQIRGVVRGRGGLFRRSSS